MSLLRDAPLVMVEWVDSFGCSTEWQELSSAKDAEPLVCRSVGWMIVDGKNVKVIVPHVHDSNELIGTTESGCGDMAIPACGVRRIVELEKVDS